MVMFLTFWIFAGLSISLITAGLVDSYDREARYRNQFCNGEYPLNPDSSNKEYALMFLAGILAGPFTLIIAYAAYLDWKSLK